MWRSFGEVYWQNSLNCASHVAGGFFHADEGFKKRETATCLLIRIGLSGRLWYYCLGPVRYNIGIQFRPHASWITTVL